MNAAKIHFFVEIRKYIRLFPTKSVRKYTGNPLYSVDRKRIAGVCTPAIFTRCPALA